MNIDVVMERFGGLQQQTALVIDDKKYSYAELVSGIAQWQHTLTEQGIKSGDCVSITGYLLSLIHI